MIPQEVAKHLAEAGVTLDEQLRVVGDGRVICCIGLVIGFYFRHRDGEDIRERTVRTFEKYHAAIGDKFVWGADPKTGAPRKVAGTPITDLRSRLPRLRAHNELEYIFHGGKRKNDGNPYTVRGVTKPEDHDRLSYVTYSLPFEWVTSQEPGAFIQLVGGLCDLLAPDYGHAGLGVIPHVGEHGNSREMKWICGMLARFRGLELELPFSHAFSLHKCNVIKGVNWLTILDQPWIDRLGGEEALRKELGPGIRWLPFRTGVIIQAGDRPLFGDVNWQEPMPAYEQVARALKPIRATNIGALASPYGFDEERTSKWLARFD